MALTVYNSKMLKKKVFKRLVLPVGDNRRFRIYLTESIVLNYKLGTNDQRHIFLDVFVLFCRASFRDKNFTKAKIFSASSLG